MRGAPDVKQSFMLQRRIKTAVMSPMHRHGNPRLPDRHR